MSHEANDLWNESVKEAIDDLEATTIEFRQKYDAQQPVVEAACEFISACIQGHHGPNKRQKKDTLHRLYEACERFQEGQL